MKNRILPAVSLPRSLFTIALLGVLSGSVPAQDGPVKATVAGVRVVRDSHGEKFGGLSAFNTQKGATLALMLRSSQGAIIAIDSRESKLDSFTDDKGTKLDVKGQFGRGGIGSFPRISDDGKAAVVEIQGGAIPAKGSVKLQAKGMLKVTVASDKKSIKSKPVKVGKDAVVKIGENYQFTMKKVGKPNFGDNVLQIDLEIKKRIDEVADIKFYTADGKPIEAKGAGSSSGGFGNNWTVTKSFSFAKKHASIIVELDYWSKKKILAVPFDISAGVGG